VYNDRGVVVLPAKVTPRIRPGVINIPQGAWYTPDENGVDRRGCINTLTKYHPTPFAKGNPQHTNLAQVEKV
jgi:anaerobic dimethyl sulfoxide reductase subunit A